MSADEQIAEALWWANEGKGYLPQLTAACVVLPALIQMSARLSALQKAAGDAVVAMAEDHPGKPRQCQSWGYDAGRDCPLCVALSHLRSLLEELWTTT